MSATQTQMATTREVTRAAKVSLGLPESHTPSSEQDKSEIEGTADYPPALFPNFLPVWEVPETKFPPLEPFEYIERALGADPLLPDLLGNDGKIEELTPAIGAEVFGVQLSKLTDKAKDQLALLTAEKKVLVFRDQDFASLPTQETIEYCRYFGRLFFHPHAGFPPGAPEITVVHRPAGNTMAAEFFDLHTNSLAWHSDNTYEVQPPGVTFLYALEVPDAGGDTVFTDMEKAYERLSPAFQERLKGLEAVHTARDQTARAIAGGSYVRREPIDTAHPLVRTHPATGKKALFVNPQFTRQIIGFKKEESDMLLNFLYNHVKLGHDMQCRVKWTNGTVIVWDNRNTCHSALTDWMDGRRRHIARITPAGERPVYKD
ncbi:hypothetical protein VTL71DRAFT_3532 [Oculimacula yallundae]|uniref:TauD/TfdA-like domain-containing protein n=1 Tax=Oculimacula yallundae TaxID=86028 RepID=A0ABR4C874_9HELO